MLSRAGGCHPLPCSPGEDPFPGVWKGWRKQRDAQGLSRQGCPPQGQAGSTCQRETPHGKALPLGAGISQARFLQAQATL